MGHIKKITKYMFDAIDDIKMKKALAFDGTNNDGLFFNKEDRKQILYYVMKEMRGTCNPKMIIELIDIELDL